MLKISDILHEDIWLGQDSFEQAEKKLLEQACEKAIEKAIEKAEMKKEDIQFYLAGDLMNQIVTSSFSARTLESPYIGLFGACSTSMEGLALAAMAPAAVDTIEAHFRDMNVGWEHPYTNRGFRPSRPSDLCGSIKRAWIENSARSSGGLRNHDLSRGSTG